MPCEMSDGEYERFKRELHDVFLGIRRGRHIPVMPLGDLTTGESSILVTIALAQRAADHVRPRRVAHMANTTPSALSQMLKSLEAKGYVVRKRLGADSRGVELELTEQGRALAKEGERMRDRYLKELFDFLGKKDVSDLIRVIRRMNVFFESKAAGVAQPDVAGACAGNEASPCA